MVHNIAAMLVVPAATAVEKAADTVATAHNAGTADKRQGQDVVLLPKPRNVPLPQAKRLHEYPVEVQVEGEAEK